MDKNNLKNDNKKELILNRLSRIEGQIKGIRRMIEAENECMDIITQVSAIRSAISALGIEMLKDDFVCRRNENRKIDEKYLKTLFKIN